MNHDKYYKKDNNNSIEDSINESSEMYQNLITYELQRCSNTGGFGFDLKGDRPAVVHSVRKGSKAEQAGLRVGDLVITINHKKVTELDHDQVVRLVGMSKNKLIIEVTKLKSSVLQSQAQSIAKQNLNNNKNYQDFHQSNNTKTTEDEESDYDDYELYLRRNRNHKHYHHHRQMIDTNESDTNFSDSQTGSIPSLSTTNSIAITSSNYITDSTSNHQQTYETEPDNNRFEDDYDYDDFDTEDTEDTEDNSNFALNQYRPFTGTTTTTTAAASSSSKMNTKLYNNVQHIQYKSNKHYLQSKHKTLNNYHNHRQRHRSLNSRNSNSLTKRNNSKSKVANIDSSSKLKISKMQLYPPLPPNMCVPITSNLQQQYNENMRPISKYIQNESIESELDEIEPPPMHHQYHHQVIKQQHQTRIRHQLTKNNQPIMNRDYNSDNFKYKSGIPRQNTNHFKDIENLYKPTSASHLLPASFTAQPETSDKFSIDSASSTFSSNQNENLQPKPYLIRQHTSKIANIKQFNNNHSSTSSLINKSVVPQLNVNDLYAILEPIIKPHIYDVKFSQQYANKNNNKFDLIYLGSVLIPYDTLSNASQLNRIRSAIEYYVVQNSTSNDFFKQNKTNDLFDNSFVCLDIFSDHIRLSSKQNKVVYVKSEIGFCGKIKDNKQYFALIILKENKNNSPNENGSITVIFKS